MQLQSLEILEVSNMLPFLLTSINLINVLYNPNCSSGIYAQEYRVKIIYQCFVEGSCLNIATLFALQLKLIPPKSTYSRCMDCSVESHIIYDLCSCISMT